MPDAAPAVNPASLRSRLVVGLEIHVELATRSKMWTDAPNVAHPDYFEAEPNTLADPVVVGMPGTLPVMNKTAVEMSIRVGLALNCQIASRCKWDRKSYYYPDLPKNYQISQYDQPLCGEGEVTFPMPDGSTRTIRITRAHLEEDAGKLLHEAPGGLPIEGSIVDLNRAGTPLLEIVTEPDFTSADEVVAFSHWLRATCRHLGVTEGIMQKGHMRFEPNINLIVENTETGETIKTPIVEIKNLNSFRAVHGAIEHERTRQVEAWLQTGKVMSARSKSTRGWDDVNLITTLQREKEDADEYRYFPDPDLVDLIVEDDWLASIRETQPELAHVKRDRYLNTYGLDAKIVDQLMDEPSTTAFFDSVLAEGVDPKRAAAFLLNTGAKLANERGRRLDELGASPAQTAGVLKLVGEGKVGSNAAGELLGLCTESDDEAASLAEQHGLVQVSDDSQLQGWVDEVIANPGMAKAVQDIRDGKDKAVGALMGQVMKLSKGQANAGVVRQMLIDTIRGE